VKAPRKQRAPEDRSDAIQMALVGLASGQDFDLIIEKLGALHIRHNTFSAEELLELASDAIDESGATRSEPIDPENIRERFLPEHHFSGRTSITRASTPSPPPP
jgi:hypothetical protein